ncbi:MAG: flagellar motor switch protein FliM [Deltaproteobacteria bacterium]|nr:flagellar motor switch protein FliM [Deltaproteobacteria bacterium]
MSETLSKDEVDALLRGMKEGEVAVEGEHEPRGTVHPYDLLAEDRLAGRRFPALDLLYERFVRRLRLSLASLVGVTPAITLGALDTIRFATFRNRLPAGACLQLFTMAPLRGQALLAISAPTAFALIDRVFGGPGRLPETLDGREYSALELQTLKRVGARMLADLAEAWTPVQRVECAFVRVEPNPVYLAIAAPADAVVAVELACDLGIGPAPLILALPYAMLEPLRDRLGAPRATMASGSDREWLATLGTAVRQAAVTVSAELGSHEISARELLRLHVGDVLALGARGDDPVTLRVENVRLMTGLAGVSRGQNAIRVLGVARGE